MQRKLLLILVFWALPWATIFLTLQLGYRTKVGVFISYAHVLEFRQNLGELDLQNCITIDEDSNPFDSFAMDPTKQLLIVGDSFGGILRQFLREASRASGKVFDFAFDSNHNHQHWSPRRVLWDGLKNQDKDWSGVTDVYIVETEGQFAVNSMHNLRRKEESRVATSWTQIRPPAGSGYLDVVLDNLFPHRMNEDQFQIWKGHPLSPEAPMRLENGEPVGKITLQKPGDTAWNRKTKWKEIKTAVEEYEQLDSLCASRGMKMTIVPIPNRSTVYAPWISLQDTTEFRAYYRALTHAIDSAGLQRIPALHLIDSAHAAGQTNLFLLHDHHWNSRGCRIITDVILSDLSSK